MVFTVFKLYSNGLLAENRRLARANSSRPVSIKSWPSWPSWPTSALLFIVDTHLLWVLSSLCL